MNSQARAADADEPVADRSEAPRPQVHWTHRAEAIGASPYHPARGAELFGRLWAVDLHGVELEPDELARLAAHLRFVTVPRGRELIVQDESGDFMLIVLEGRIAVDRVQPWGTRARLAEARAGEMLGEMSLLDAGARFSACSSLDDCVLAVLDAEGLAALMRSEPRLALALMTTLARRLSLRLRQVSARLSALLSGA